jgi:type II secretory pathway pseudopilin PulG
MRSIRAPLGNLRTRSTPALQGWTWLELLVTIVASLAILLVLITLFVPSLEPSRAETRRVQCRHYLKQIGQALHHYHDKYNSFPPAFTVDTDGRRLHSWRTLILPYLDSKAVYKQINLNKPWDDPANAEARKSSPSEYTCPAAETKPGQTTYLAVAIPGGIFERGKATSLKDIKDFKSNTLLVIEVNANRSVHWMDPTDLDAAGFVALSSDELPHRFRGFHALLADGSVRVISLDELAVHGHAWVTIAGGEPLE